MKRFFVLILTLGFLQGLTVLSFAEHRSGEKDGKGEKEKQQGLGQGREIDKEKGLTKGGKVERSETSGNTTDDPEKADKTKGRSKSSHKEKSEGVDREEGSGSLLGTGNRRDRSRSTEKGWNDRDPGKQDRFSFRGEERGRKVRAYQWKDKSEEKKGRALGWEKPVRLTEDARKKGLRQLPQYISNRKEYVHTRRDQSIIRQPDRDWEGRSFKARTIDRGDNKIVIDQMRRVTLNRNFSLQINIYNERETQTNHYYWHYDNGFRYCHYRDPWGYRWFGWYVGSSYFWTRYYAGRFWWYDGAFDRWCYWNDGYWWWQDPYRVNAIYIYDNTRYIQAVSDEDLEVGLPEDADPSDMDHEKADVKIYRSKDETRMVKIIGKDAEAFLYDTGSDHPFKPVFLGQRVKEVRFSNPSSGRSLQIMLVYRDGSFELFDSRGRSMGEKDL